MRVLLSVLAITLVAGLTGCSPTPRATAPATLTATLTDPTDIRLNWPAAPSDALGQVVEYRNQPTAQFVTLAYLPANATSYTHARLIPKTPFYYRIRAFFGHLTAPVTATIGAGPTPTDPGWATPRAAARPSAGHHPLRGSNGGAPTGLAAQPVGPDGVLLSWTDHATDADSYLVEVTPPNSSTVRIAAVLPPGADQIGIYPQPDEHTAMYRVVAIYYGQPTPTVHQTTE